MKVYWTYMCDKGHSWELFRDENAVESNRDAMCPFGHEAVTLKKCRPANAIQFVVRSASRFVDDLKQQVVGEGRYYVALTGLEGDDLAVSAVPMGWQEAIDLIGKLRDLSPPMATKYLHNLKQTQPAGEEKESGQSGLKFTK